MGKFGLLFSQFFIIIGGKLLRRPVSKFDTGLLAMTWQRIFRHCERGAAERGNLNLSKTETQL